MIALNQKKKIMIDNNLAYPLKYDSVYGRYEKKVKARKDFIPDLLGPSSGRVS
jgi:glyceraldehyde-3-phosphate dehydrogenase/erythrose-4-phosphate dehydrogenase